MSQEVGEQSIAVGRIAGAHLSEAGDSYEQLAALLGCETRVTRRKLGYLQGVRACVLGRSLPLMDVAIDEESKRGSDRDEHQNKQADTKARKPRAQPLTKRRRLHGPNPLLRIEYRYREGRNERRRGTAPRDSPFCPLRVHPRGACVPCLLSVHGVRGGQSLGEAS